MKGWRERLLASMPSTPTIRRVMSYAELDQALDQAASLRRMRPEEYAMRAIRAMVEFDLSITGDELRDAEPLLHDIRRGHLPPVRYRGKGFGLWRVGGVDE